MARPSPQSAYSAAAAESPFAAAERMLKVYGLAIDAAIQRNATGVCHCIGLLRATIDPSVAPELALSLAAIYADIEKAAAEEDFAAATELLESLRGLWQARLKLDRISASLPQ